MKARVVEIKVLLPDDGSPGLIGKYSAWMQNARSMLPWLDYEMRADPPIEVHDLRNMEVDWEDWFITEETG